LRRRTRVPKLAAGAEHIAIIIDCDRLKIRPQIDHRVMGRRLGGRRGWRRGAGGRRIAAVHGGDLELVAGACGQPGKKEDKHDLGWQIKANSETEKMSVPTLAPGWLPAIYAGAMSFAMIRAVVGSGPAVTIRASPVFVRADSISTVDITWPSPNRLEWHSGFVRASRLQRSAFDLLRLPSTLDLLALGAM